jgi:GTP-binding protein
MKTPVFKDRVKIYVNAGNGGDGGSYFRREKFVAFGGPSGGDGGNGGSVYLEGNPQLDSLLDLYFRPHQKAEHGVNGGTKDCYGRRGEDKVVQVPCGTVVHLEDGSIFGEIIEPGERLCVAKGGEGGLGNIHFKTSSNQAPTECTPGTEGVRRVLWLELKSIADVGLVGYPNAGKSTLLTKLTNAHPKVGAYPFTTLNPIIGTLESYDYRKMRIADIPGLIDGAADGVGLGHDFLRHIERTRFLVYVLDMGGEEGRSPLDDYEQLQHELKAYQSDLLDRPFLVVANKMDVPGSSENLKEFKQATGLEPLEMCAELGEGVEVLAKLLWEKVPDRVFKRVEKEPPPA